MRKRNARAQLDGAGEVVVLQQRVEDVVAEGAGVLVGLAHAVEAALGAGDRHADHLSRIGGVRGTGKEQCNRG